MSVAAPSEASRLKAKHRACLDQHAEPSRVRLHRAISWLARALEYKSRKRTLAAAGKWK